MSCDRRGIQLAKLTVANCAAGGGGGISYRTLWLAIPDARLQWHFTLTAVPTPPSRALAFDVRPIVDDDTPLSRIQITPHVPARVNGSEAPAALAPMFVDADGTPRPEPLPIGVEGDGQCRLYKIRVAIAFLAAVPYGSSLGFNEADAAESGPGGRAIATCTVEPLPDALFAEGELAALLNDCSLTLDGGPAVTIAGF